MLNVKKDALFNRLKSLSEQQKDLGWKRFLKELSYRYKIYFLDLFTKKDSRYWAFPVCCFNRKFLDNSRAVFEEIKNDPSIRKIILVRDDGVSDLGGVNVESLSLASKRGLDLLLNRYFINLWLGTNQKIKR